MFKKIIAAVVLFALTMVVVVQAMEKENTSANQPPGVDIGFKAKDFELQTIDGKTVKLSDYKGQRIMLNFWTTWCPPCKAEMPDMEALHKEKGEEIKIVSVNIDPDNDVAGFVEEYGLTFPILLDKKEDVMKQYNIISIPTTFFIDEDGIIKQKIIGAIPLDKMKEYLSDL
ncbi:peroxiredoxin family protein [Bacillus dakarensis]|uniref:peroxiredoxin family protein n=1 Tax=Robertmurraya dakarensis TaxID=1926278 RepID=UPI00098243E6|nr:TlpA disulfide reductase family protein [Bacillus dakarensis]